MMRTWTCMAAGMAKMAMEAMSAQNQKSMRGCWAPSTSGTRKTTSTTRSAQSTARRARPAGKNILETALANGSFTTLTTALAKANLLELVQGDKPITVFAPTDAAFAQIPEETLASLLLPENRSGLATVLGFHVVAGRLDATAVSARRQLDTLSGQRLSIAVEDGAVSVGGAVVISADIACSNGIIHVIDTVMMPSIDDIPTALANDGRFSTLVDLVTRAELVDVLGGDGPFTLFAPTDEAFAALPAETVADLTQEAARDRLRKVLTYHAVSGRVFAREAATAEKTAAVSGDTLFFGFRDGRLTVENAVITQTDLQTRNGVIHVIDKVLIP